ncbi:hypothetical protein Trydic_g20246 [Trypoxylus dichotomus]
MLEPANKGRSVNGLNFIALLLREKYIRTCLALDRNTYAAFFCGSRVVVKTCNLVFPKTNFLARPISSHWEEPNGTICSPRGYFPAPPLPRTYVPAKAPPTRADIREKPFRCDVIAPHFSLLRHTCPLDVVG